MRTRLLLAGLMLLPGPSGCGDTAQHPLTLVSPVVTPCDRMKDPGCMPAYASCADLNLNDLQLSIGLFDSVSTSLSCPQQLDGQHETAAVGVPYHPGANFYLVQASYPRDTEEVVITAGPFPEADDRTPWQVLLR